MQGNTKITLILCFLLFSTVAVHAQKFNTFEAYFEQIQDISERANPKRCFDVVPIEDTDQALVYDYYCFGADSCNECIRENTIYQYHSLVDYDPEYPDEVPYQFGVLWRHAQSLLWSFTIPENSWCGEGEAYDEAGYKGGSLQKICNDQPNHGLHSTFSLEELENKHDD